MRQATSVKVKSRKKGLKIHHLIPISTASQSASQCAATFPFSERCNFSPFLITYLEVWPHCYKPMNPTPAANGSTKYGAYVLAIANITGHILKLLWNDQFQLHVHVFTNIFYYWANIKRHEKSQLFKMMASCYVNWCWNEFQGKWWHLWGIILKGWRRSQASSLMISSSSAP